ncbi:MAG TPA: CPBP family intramembrane glutamic endopeptidase [Candidatus Polarisedimenticolaceae bacterium]|nr:CPBP family intramembrane glutamic endopeptidase [Candidatus Polarisedimenticolaceae bacterium]
MTQLGIGILTGIVSVLLLIYVPAFSDVRRFAHQMIGQQLNPSKTEIPLIAIATGVGEELLYRAVIQPFVGIWVTSLLFALSHVGIDLKKPYMIAFNMFLFVMSMAMGALYIWVGLVAAIAAHITYNIGIMSYIHSKKA